MKDAGKGNQEVFGFFLNVTDKEGHLLFDHFQDELEIAQKQAFRKWNVPVESWAEIPVDTPAY